MIRPLALALAFGAGAAAHAALAPGPRACLEQPLWPSYVLQTRLDGLEYRMSRDAAIIERWKSFKQFTEDRRKRKEKRP